MIIRSYFSEYVFNTNTSYRYSNFHVKYEYAKIRTIQSCMVIWQLSGSFRPVRATSRFGDSVWTACAVSLSYEFRHLKAQYLSPQTLDDGCTMSCSSEPRMHIIFSSSNCKGFLNGCIVRAAKRFFASSNSFCSPCLNVVVSVIYILLNQTTTAK